MLQEFSADPFNVYTAPWFGLLLVAAAPQKDMAMLPDAQPLPPLTPRLALRILVADDEPMIVRALQRLLERRGHEVHAAPDAYQAIELLSSFDFDAVLVDAQMPGGGPSVLDALRESDFNGVSILMTGGIATDAASGRDGVRLLQKPFPFPSVIPLLEGGVRS